MEFVYFTDPMCSWCYGFGPEVRKLAATYAGAVALNVVPGGLRPYESSPTPERKAREIVHHWEHVAHETGRPFDTRFFERHPGFVYDTYPASRALVAVKRLEPTLGFAYLEQLHERFYAKGEDPTALATFTAAAGAIGLAGGVFQAAFEDSATDEKTRDGFAYCQRFGGLGFPMVLLKLLGKSKIVTIGYQPFEHLDAVVRNILAKESAGAH
jgi:putative protein-disulfide isomerase